MSTAETLALVREALSKSAGDLAKAATFSAPTVATQGLQTYDLEAAVKNLVPWYSPLRNDMPRVKGGGGSQANWKAVVGYNTQQINAGVSDGRRGGQINAVTAEYYAAYRTIGLESSATMMAEEQAEGFDDLRARSVMGLMNSMFLEEERIILGANATNPIGQTPTPSLSIATSGGTIAHPTTVSVICVALTFDAWRRFNTGSTIIQQFQRQNMDGTTETVNGGTAIPSAAGSGSTASGSANMVTAKVTPLRGAYGYAWFAGTAGAEKFHSITTVSQVVITALPGTGQLASTLIATDFSADSLIHDGLLGMVGKTSMGAYHKAVTAGTSLTPDGAGGIVEFDDALRYWFDTHRLVPDEILIATQEVTTLKKIMVQQGAATSLARFTFTFNPQGQVIGSAAPLGYTNAYGSQKSLKITQHPDMPPGTVMFLTKSLPYAMNNITNIMQIKTLRDYHQIEWPLRTRAYEFGVYSNQVLQHYFPPSMGVITNLSPA